MNKPLGLAAAMVLALQVAACSGSDDDANSGSGDDIYCDKVEEAKSSLEALELSTSSQEDWDQAGSMLDDIADDAPSDIKGDWENIAGYFDDFQAALDDVGLSIEDLSAAQGGEPPEGVSVEDLQALQPKLTKIVRDWSLEESLSNVASDAQERCGIALDETGDAEN
jgi:hypothetical protein